MIPKTAIETAIEGGWKYNAETTLDAEIALDPHFWQALGKELGWLQNDMPVTPDTPTVAYEKPQWVWMARRFYDLILTGGDITAFWDELLTV